MKIHNDIIQRSDEWFDLRAGRPTASRFGDIVTAKTGKLSASHIPYMCKLVKESLFPCYETGDEFISEAMAHGIVYEPEARKYYEAITGHKVAEVGFITMDDADGIAGASPDGLIGLDWGLEIKCPQPETHIRYVHDGVLPDAYKAQVHGSMVVTGLDRWDFLSYHPQMNHLLVTVERDEFTEKVAEVLKEFTVKYAEFRNRILPKLKTK